MKKLSIFLLTTMLLLLLPACSSGMPAEQETEDVVHISTVEYTQDSMATDSETISDRATEDPVSSKEESMKQEQFYITAGGTTFTVDFAENSSADALRELMENSDLTIDMSDYGNFEKVGSIGQSLPCKDTQISTTTGDVMLYQGNQIVIFYGDNSWSYSRLGKIQDVTKEDLLGALGSGNITVTFSLIKPK